MIVRPAWTDLVQIQIVQGDIFDRSGDFLITGRLKGVRLPHPNPYKLEKEDPWVFGRSRTRYYDAPEARWPRLIEVNARPRRADYMGTNEFHRLRVTQSLWSALVSTRAATAKKPQTIGIVPLSWRNEKAVAYTLAHAIDDYLMNWSPDDYGRKRPPLHILITSLDSVDSLCEAFITENYRAYYDYWASLSRRFVGDVYWERVD